MRLIHLSDVHLWRYTFNPLRLMGKRSVGVLDLLRGRAAKFRLERIGAVVKRIESLDADHLVITGDLTTTALDQEFRDAREALDPLLGDPTRVSIVPGNHDRYTGGSLRHRTFEAHFGAFAGGPRYPWLRALDDDTAILGLDPTRPHISARGFLPDSQLEAAGSLVRDRPRRLILACHYPLAAPPNYERELRHKRMRNSEQVADWARTIGPHLYCCGHVHAAWAFTPSAIPNQLCLNAGAPLMHDRTGFRLPGFLEVEIEGDGVTVIHHAWNGDDWMTVPLIANPTLFATPDRVETV